LYRELAAAINNPASAFTLRYTHGEIEPVRQ